MGRRRNVPEIFGPSYGEDENARKSSLLDPTSLVSQQFHRPPTEGQPMGPAEDLPVRASSSWSDKHGDFED